MGRMATRPGTERSATGVSLTALKERVHSYRAIPPGRKYFLLMKKATRSHIYGYTSANVDVDE
jgi:hypothetical protein